MMKSGPANLQPPPAAACPACGASIRGQFCHRCGARVRPIATPVAPMLRWVPWVIGTTFVALFAVALFRKNTPAPVTAQGMDPKRNRPANVDLSNLSPAERFDRLYQRVIAAAQSGDQATVTEFTPMAVAAYQALDTITVDARYHLAMLQMHVGNLAGAQAQADTVQRREPNHLFGYVIAAAVARWSKQDSARVRYQRQFSERYDAEIATPKPEYREHQAMLNELRKSIGAARN